MTHEEYKRRVNSILNTYIESLRSAGVKISAEAAEAMKWEPDPIGCPLCGGKVGRFQDAPCRCLGLDHGDDERRSSHGK